MLASLARTGVAVTAEEHRKAGGLADAIREVAAEQYPVPIFAVGVGDRFGVSGTGEAVMERFGLTAAGIADTVRQALVLKPVVSATRRCSTATTRAPSTHRRRPSESASAQTALCGSSSPAAKCPCILAQFRASCAGTNRREPGARDAPAEARARRARGRQLRDATVVYPGGNVGLDGVSLAIERGEFAFLVGADRLRQVDLHPAADAGGRGRRAARS